MTIRAFFLAIAFLVSGCSGNSANQVIANFQYSNAGNLGTQNAGLFEPGTLFLWNTFENELSFLEVLKLQRVGGTPASADVSSTNVSAIELSGVPVGGDNDLLKASVGAQASFTAKAAVREDYGQLITALSSYATDLKEQGNDPDLVLRSRAEGFRLVLIRSAIRAESSELRVGGVDATKPNSIISVSVGSGVSVDVKAGSNTSCSRPSSSNTGSLPACFFNIAVFDPRYVEGNPRLQFVPVGKNLELLSDAFRDLR